MILVETSAWVEFLRATGSAAHLRLAQLVHEGDRLVTTDVVLMEILAGARNSAERDELRRLLARCDFEAVQGPADYEDAAALYTTCRQRGETVRGLTNCLIAAVAIRSGCELLHNDAEFEKLARHSPLKLAS